MSTCICLKLLSYEGYILAVLPVSNHRPFRPFKAGMLAEVFRLLAFCGCHSFLLLLHHFFILPSRFFSSVKKNSFSLGGCRSIRYCVAVIPARTAHLGTNTKPSFERTGERAGYQRTDIPNRCSYHTF